MSKLLFYSNTNISLKVVAFAPYSSLVREMHFNEQKSLQAYPWMKMLWNYVWEMWSAVMNYKI